MEHLLRTEIKASEDFFKDAWRRFICPDLTGNNEMLKPFKDAQGLENRVKSSIEIGNDAKANASLSKRTEHMGHSRR